MQVSAEKLPLALMKLITPTQHYRRTQPIEAAAAYRWSWLYKTLAFSSFSPHFRKNSFGLPHEKFPMKFLQLYGFLLSTVRTHMQ